jgi:hypothetical protein
LQHGQSINDINFEGWFPSNALKGKRKSLIRLVQSFRPNAQNGNHTNGKRRKSKAANSSPAKKFALPNKRLLRTYAGGNATPRQ